MNFNSMTFWVIVVLVVLYGIVCILETLSKDKNAQSGFSAEDDHDCCSDYEYNYKSGRESMKYMYEGNSLD